MTPAEPKLVPVILSGGTGTRLWPLSREGYPKQFWPLGGEATQLYALFNALGHGGTDFSGIVRMLRGDVS